MIETTQSDTRTVAGVIPPDGEGVRYARAVCDELLAAARDEQAAAARQLRLVAELIDLFDHVQFPLPVDGAERLVPAGADGTPEVAEFLPLELAPLLGVTVVAAWQLVRDASNLRDRHPHTWAAVHELRLPPWQGRLIARAAADAELDAEAARAVDERMASALGGSTPMGHQGRPGRRTSAR